MNGNYFLYPFNGAISCLLFKYHLIDSIQQGGIAMTDIKKLRIFWLKLMYGVTIVIAGCLGIGILFIPGTMQFTFGADCPRFFSGMIGSVFLAFALVSVLGLRDPVKFVPLLLTQMLYKSAWLCFVALPLLIAGKMTVDMILAAAVFLAIVIGDLIAIPFSKIFGSSRDAGQMNG
jgi:hypothetical protein